MYLEEKWRYPNKGYPNKIGKTHLCQQKSIPALSSFILDADYL